jgi:hypothetical protein
VCAIISGVIPPSEDSFFPTGHGPFGRAIEKLREAEQGIAEMMVANDRVSYEAGWTRFIDSIEEFWTRFRTEGRALSEGFDGWVGNQLFEGTRKTDPLLRYIRRFRNQSQHAGAALGWSDATSLAMGQGFRGCISSLVVLSNRTFVADAEPAASSKKQSPVSADYGKPHLPSFHDALNTEQIIPPDSHLGSSLGTVLPHEAAALAHIYYKNCLCDAEKRFVK